MLYHVDSYGPLKIPLSNELLFLDYKKLVSTFAKPRFDFLILQTFCKFLVQIFLLQMNGNGETNNKSSQLQVCKKHSKKTFQQILTVTG